MASLCMFAATAAAQSSARPPSSTSSDASDGKLALVGCVERAADGQFALTFAHAVPPPAAGTTGGLGADSTASTTSSGTGGQAAEKGALPERWALKGGTNLEAHVGHKVQVTGRGDTAESMRSPAATAGTTVPDSRQTVPASVLEVQSVVMVAASCP